MTLIFLFRKNKKFNILKTLFLLLVCSTIVILFVFKNIYNLKGTFPNISQFNIYSSDELTEETLVNQVKNVNKLIPLEIELSETLILDNTYFDLAIFKKVKRLTFFANCSYYVDLSKLSSNEIHLDNISREIAIKIPKPEIFNISIDESKTIYGEPELGLLRFGDLELSSEDLKKLHENLYESFSNKMKDERFYNQAISNTKESLENLLLDLTGEYYKLTLTF